MKAIKSVSLDPDNIKYFEEKKINISSFCNEAMTKHIEKEKAPIDYINGLEKELKNLNEKKTEIEDKIKNTIAQIKEIEEKQKEYAEQQRKEAIRLRELRAKNIKEEIERLPKMREQGFFRNRLQREKTYKNRAKTLGLTVEEYLSEVINHE